MSLRTEFQSLYEQLKRLNEALCCLNRVINDRPPKGGRVLLLDEFGDAVTDTVGRLEEAQKAVEPLLEGSQQKGEPSFDIGNARQALVFCQEQFNSILRRFMDDLVSYDWVAQLMQLGRERRGEWQTWAGVVKLELEGCQHHLYDTNQALFRCWLEIAERVGMTSVSVQTTNIGQQVAVPQNQDLTADGMT